MGVRGVLWRRLIYLLFNCVFGLKFVLSIIDFMAVLQEFKNFIVKGNAIDLAVGVLIGAAFGKFVSAFTEGIINPLLQLAGGDVNVSLKLWIFDVGLVVNAAFSLLITGAILFFIFVKPMNKLRDLTAKSAPAAPPAPPEPTAEEKLLTEIRDLLKDAKAERSE